MHRFFVHDTSLQLQQTSQGEMLILPERVAHQVRDVLHLHKGEGIVLLDNSGEEFVAEVTRSERKIVEVQLVERRAGRNESPINIILCQGLLKSARFELILEKGTELGVSVFAPILCRRSTSGLEDAGQSKVARWQRILQEATEQCGRSRLPRLFPIRPFADALESLPTNALTLIPWEEEKDHSLRHTLQTHREQKTVVLFIGPEGGLTTEEIVLAQQHGVLPVTLGGRILRAETAALAAVANVMYELEQG